jgi:hypothetical protein
LWVGQVSNFFALVGGSAEKQVAYASTLLQGVAQTWWQRQLRSGDVPTSWTELSAKLIGRFRNVSKTDAAMAELMNIRQRKEESTHDYICRFEAALDRVDSYDESWLLKMFIWGLPQEQAVIVSQGRPHTLSAAFQLARDASLAAQMARRPGGRGDGGQKQVQNQQGKAKGSTGGKSGSWGTSTSNVQHQQQQNRGQGQRQSFGNFSRGRGQAGKSHVPPQATVLVHQSAPTQPGGSGQRGRGRGNQRRPRVAFIAAQDDEGMAGQVGQEAAQHAAGHGSDASLRQGQGN